MTFQIQTVFENTLMQHHVALPPDAMGKISYIAPPGQYSLKVLLSPLFLYFQFFFFFFGIDFVALMAIYIVVQDTVLELEFQGVKKQFTMLQVVYFSMLLIFTTLVALLTRLMED